VGLSVALLSHETLSELLNADLLSKEPKMTESREQLVNEPREWATLDSEIVYKNSYFAVLEDEVSLPAGEETTFVYISRSPAVIIAPILDNGQVVLVRQYRYIIGQDSWELPAGSVVDGETPAEAASRELEEETGYVARTLAPMNRMFTSNGTTDEVVHAFAALDLSHTSQKLEITECDMVVRAFGIQECTDMILRGDITCAGTSLTLLYLQHWLSSKRCEQI
jgi:ADP-ribose pyrophosphatase